MLIRLPPTLFLIAVLLPPLSVTGNDRFCLALNSVKTALLQLKHDRLHGKASSSRNI